MTSRLIVAIFTAATLILAGCKDTKTTKQNGTNGSGTEVETPFGTPLGSAPFGPAATPDSTPNPITVPLATVIILRKLDVSSEVDGAVKFIGVEISKDEADKLKSADVFKHPRDEKWFRRLVPGNFVKRGQMIAMLDDEVAFYDWDGAKTKAEAAKDSAEAFKETIAQLNLLADQQRRAAATKIGTEQELYNSLATLARYKADLVEHQGNSKVAIAEAQKAKTAFEKRTIRSAIDGEVQQVMKHEGEGVKAAEPMLVVHEFGQLRAVGNLPKEYINVVSPGDEVTIEVPRDTPAIATFEQHTTNKPIVAVGVTTVGGKPVIVSAAEDGWVYAWDRDRNVLQSWRVNGGVRSLAVTRAGADPALALVGGSDGIARVYNLSTMGKDPARQLDGRHEGGVTAAAFSPDGKYCVTADEHGIYMNEVSTQKRKYTFSSKEHHSAITSLSFTPQGRVVSAGREPSIRVWVVGTEGARVEHCIDSRTGDITMPGVSDDGSRLLLDADKTQLDVIHLQELRKERPLVTAGEAARFTNFSAWSPDSRVIATTGAAEGIVQLWKAPTAKERASEIARLVTRDGSAATCAAFSPVADNGFVVVGTRKGHVHLWQTPAADVQEEIKAKVTHVEQSIESSGRTVNVLVDFENPKLGENRYLLRPGAAVTLVIRPKR